MLGVEWRGEERRGVERRGKGVLSECGWRAAFSREPLDLRPRRPAEDEEARGEGARADHHGRPLFARSRARKGFWLSRLTPAPARAPTRTARKGRLAMTGDQPRDCVFWPTCELGGLVCGKVGTEMGTGTYVAKNDREGGEGPVGELVSASMKGKSIRARPPRSRSLSSGTDSHIDHAEDKGGVQTHAEADGLGQQHHRPEQERAHQLPHSRSRLLGA